MPYQSFKQLTVWQEAKALAVAIYKTTMDGKFARDFGLRDQIQRSAVSIPSNIAEGYERRSPKEFLYFLSIAQGSLSELRTQLEIANDIGYISKETFLQTDDHCCKIGAMMTNLRKSRTTESPSHRITDSA